MVNLLIGDHDEAIVIDLLAHVRGLKVGYGLLDGHILVGLRALARIIIRIIGSWLLHFLFSVHFYLLGLDSVSCALFLI